MRILIIEDDDDIRTALEEVLEFEDYHVHVEAAADRALEWLKCNPRPSVIMLDLMMPGMDGFDFRREQMKIPELATIPVVLITASRQTIAPSFGFYSVLHKPLSIDTMTSVLRSATQDSDAWSSETTKPEFRK